MRHKHGRTRNGRRNENTDVMRPKTSTGNAMKNVGIVPLCCHNMKPKKKEPRRRQENEKRKEDKNEDPHRGQLAPTHAEKLSHYFKSDELVELRNIVQSSDLSDVPLLLAAVMLGKFDVVKRLFKEGAAIDSQGHEHTTPLMWAVKHKNMEMIDLLIRRGANITIEDDRGDNAILLAMQTSDWDQDSFLDFWNSVKECEAFDLNHANKCGYTMLHYATKNQWENVLNYLLAQEVNVNCQTNKGVTPLMMAASRNHSQFVKAILNAKADVGVEDERSCTALCYIIAFVVQKHLELPNPTLEALMNTIENSRTQMSLETYLKRRLDILLKPPDGSNYADVISTIVHPIFVFFVRFTKTGIELLLEQRVFARLAEATEAHLDDPDLIHALLGLMLELLRYCQCCYGGGQCPFPESQIMDLFVDQGGANVCLMILKIYNNMVTNKWLLVAALMPILTACTTEGKPRFWLETHFKEILPYYNNFLGMCLVKFNISADEYHMSLLRKRAKEFRKLMSKLERGESICKQNEEPVIADPEQEQFIAEQETTSAEPENYIGDLGGTVPEQDYCVAEQETYAMDQDYYIAEQENYYVEQENNLTEQDYYAMDQEYALAQQRESSVLPQEYSMVEQDNYVDRQENFITDQEHSICSISSAQNVTMSSNSLDDISDPEMTNVHSFTYPKKVRRKVAKTLKAKVSTFKEFEYPFYVDRSGSQNDYNQSFERNEQEAHLEQLSSFQKTYTNSENLIIDVTDSQSNMPPYTSDGNYEVNTGHCDGTEDYIPLDTSKYATKIIDKINSKNIHIESSQKPSDTVNPMNFSDLSNNKDNFYINADKDENAAGDISKRNRHIISDKETTTLFTTVDNQRRNNIRSFDLSSNYNESLLYNLDSSVDKGREHILFESDENIQSATEKLQDAQNSHVESITTLDTLFKKLLIKYVKSWQYEHDNNYPGHCGGGDGINSEKNLDENFKKLKPFLSKLENSYILYLKSIWVSFQEKLLDTDSADLFKDTATQVLDLIRMQDKKLDVKIRQIDEYVQKQIQSESDISATVSNTDSKETISSLSRAHSVADSDGHSDETRSFLKDMDEEENSMHPMPFKYLSGVNCPLNIPNTLEDSVVRCWEPQGRALFSHATLIGQEMSLPKEGTSDIPKLLSDQLEDINAKTNIISIDSDADTLESIRVRELINVGKVCTSMPTLKDDLKHKVTLGNHPSSNSQDDDDQPKKLSFAELFKDPSISLAITSQGAAINTNIPNTQSAKLPRFPTAAFITMGSNDTRTNNADGHHPQFVHPPPGFPAHPLLSLESLLRLQTDVNNGHGIRQAPPLPVYISLPDALLCPEKIAVFTSGRAMDSASVNPDITQLAPLVMFPGVPNYTSRWKFLISVLQNIPPTYCQWCLDGVTMKRISLFDGPLKLPGGGNFGDVFFGLSDNKHPLAAKVMYINPSNSSPTVGLLLQKLVNPLLKLRHEHILSYIQCVHHECKLFLISPLCECNLGEYLMCLKLHNKLEYRSAELVKQLLLGLNFLHTLPLPIIHGNLKPSNVLLDEHGTLKLADFGLHPILYQVLPPPSSSIIWWSRETHDIYKQKNNLHCTFKSDIQVAGMMIHFIMTGGLHPFGAEAQEIIENVCKGRIKLKTLSCDINDLISWMMVFDPKSRPTILEVMSHVYFWDVSKKWNFVLGCCGIDCEGQALPIPLTEFHSTLDLKATEDNVKGDWVSIVKPAFPEMDPVEANSTDTPTGLLRFIRTCVEGHTEKKNSTIPHNLQNFFLSAFPALTLSLYRLVEETEWRKHPVMANLLKGND